MDIMYAILLGAIQGLTEFLPVSSSGHLVLSRHLFGFTDPALFFDVCVHLGTLCAVMIVFRESVMGIISAVFRFGKTFLLKKRRFIEETDNPDLRLGLMIALGSIPTAIIGLLLHSAADRIFSSVILVGGMLIITGSLLWATRWKEPGRTDIPRHFILAALIVGVVQGLAIFPGISRSGSTIATCLFLGFSRETAGRFSFLLSIPAIVGATLLTLRSAVKAGISLDPAVLAGMATAFVVGYGALVLLLKIVRQGRLYVFAPYCWLVGLLALGAALR